MTKQSLVPGMPCGLTRPGCLIRWGLRAARGRGKQLGRPRSLTPPLERDIAEKLAEGSAVKALARDYGLDPIHGSADSTEASA